MKINFDVQQLCVLPSQMRGIQYYEINLLKELVKDLSCSVIVSFFDYLGERGNRKKLLKNLGEELYSRMIIQECGNYSYRDLMNSIVDHRINFEDYTNIWDCSGDIVHFPTGQFVPSRIGKKSVVTVHDITPLIPYLKDEVLDINRQYLKASINNIKNNKEIEIITDSDNTKKDLIYYYEIEPERINTVYLSHNADTMFKENNSPYIQKYQIEEPFLLYIGAFMTYKGIREILRSFLQLKNKYKRLKMVFAGSPDAMDKNIKKELERYPCVEELIFTGAVTEEEKRGLFSQAEAFLFPSYYEGFGIPVLEALACGCPVIATNVSSIPEVGGNAVMYVDKGSYTQLTEAIDTILSNRCIRDEYIQRGYQQIRKYSWAKTAEDVKKIYEKISRV